MLGGCGDEDMLLLLKYYEQDEQERKLWAEGLDPADIPAWRRPPYDRDRHLPQSVELEPVFEDEYAMGGSGESEEGTSGDEQFRDDDIPF
jgi:hypothetical protein